jgi:hypothetical protein
MLLVSMKKLPFSFMVICSVSNVMIPSVNGSSSSLTVVLERAGTHLFTTKSLILQSTEILHRDSQREKGVDQYPRGTALCNHR